ncbi:MAG: gliding motility-associated C-terminal domain-containing protein [Chitinophagales bacterium]
MKYKYLMSLIFILISCISTAFAQNQVLNYSFENFPSCPEYPDDITNWQSPYQIVSGDTCSTPDAYNSCNNIPFGGGIGVPDNILGFQYAHSGEGYVGIILYDAFALTGCSNTPTGWREYVEGTLDAPLIAGETYCVSFYVNLADDVKFATDDIGVYFSNSLVNIDCSTVGNASDLPFTPQLQYTGQTLTDTSNWTRLEWAYTASGGEQYIIIGNFNDDANTSYTCVNPNAINSHAYYYIDDVEVTLDLCCPVIDIVNRTSVSCNGLSDGATTVSVTGGVPPYSYSWSAGTSSDEINTNLPAGRHTLSVSDSRGCQVSKNIVIEEPDELSVSIVELSTSCGNTITATTAGGTGPFTYNWSNGASGASLSNVPTGTLSVTVTDDNGCTDNSSINVTQVSTFTITPSSTDNTSCAQCNGTATANVNGGTPPFTYEWSNGQTGTTADSLCEGTYTVTVTEGGSGGGGGSVFWSEDFSSGGTGWSLNINGPGANDADANEWVINSNVNECSNCPDTGSLGNYLHITCTSTPCQLGGDNGTCVYDQGVPFFAEAATDKYVSSPNISTMGRSGITLTFWYMSGGESGADYGLVRLSDDGGTTWSDLPAQYQGVQTCTQASVNIPAAYENLPDFRIGFRWINDNNTDGDDPPFMIDDIELSDTSSSACTATASVTVDFSGSGLNASIDSISNISCNGENDGYMSASSGSNFSYNWSNGETTQDISGLSPGTYTITIEDNNNCSITLSDTIHEPEPLTLTGNSSGSGCDGDAAIAINVTGGTPSYSYEWSNDSTGNTISNLNSGDYTVTVTDVNNCTASESFNIDSTGSFNIDLTAVNASCPGVNDGQITSSVSGANLPLSYSWSNGQQSADLNNVDVGTYSVTISDANNCTVSASETVFADENIEVFAGISQPICPENQTGAIKITPLTGTPPYTGEWSNGENQVSISNLEAGTYSLTLTDSAGCVLDTSFDVNSLSNFEIQTTSSGLSCSDTEGNASAATEVTSGNTAPYTYAWNTGDSTQNISGLESGTYIVTVSDSLGCNKVDTVNIFAAGLFLNAEIINESCPDEGDGAIITTVAGGFPPYTYNWSTGSADSSILNLSAGEYELTVSDAEDCSASEAFEVELSDNATENCDTLIIYDVFSPNGDVRNDIWIIDGLFEYTDNELQIFNRWGGKVFEANPYDNDWDGRSMKGEALPTATYYYILKVKNGSEKVYSGHVNIIR